MSNYHVPVMLQECIDGLQIKPNGIYIDVTFGGGGHSKAIEAQLTTGKLFSFDQDKDAVANTAAFDKNKFQFVAANFRYIKKYMRLYGITQVDGILADLGVSSYQLDEGSRGFSFMQDADLDMRMNQNSEKSAKTVLNEYSADELHKILGIYGEIKNAKTVAQKIVSARINQPINTIEEFKAVLTPCAPKHREYKYFAQVFQAIRMEVNDELKALEEMLVDSGELLAPGGRFVVMSYHSLEDRLVKNYFQKGKFHGSVEKDFYGNEIKPLQTITRKPIEASKEEQEINRRARSAKLRIAEKR